MRTDQLIELIVADTTASPPLGRRLGAALAVGGGLALLLMLTTIGPRPDLAAALGSARVLFKIGFTLLLALAASAVALGAGVPGRRPRAAPLAAPLLVLALGAAAELRAVPAADWGTRLLGDHAAFCLLAIPVLALPPLGALIWALRGGAPDRPGVAGAAAGLAAGGLAAAAYAWHCPDDSPLFVAAWYTLAVGAVTFAGALIGRRALRW